MCVTLKVNNVALELDKNDYKLLTEALRAYGDVLDNELRSIRSGISVPEAKTAAEEVVTTKMLALQELFAKFNAASVSLSYGGETTREFGKI
jgi:hypothetical protein